MKYFKHWHGRGLLAIVAAAWLCPGFGTAGADTITVGETTYEDVLVLITDSSYYIFLPEEGKILDLRQEDVGESRVMLIEDPARQAELKLRYDISVERNAAQETDASDTASDEVFGVSEDEGASAGEHLAAATANAPALMFQEILKVGPVAPEDATIRIVEFWATWCGPCRRSIPHLSQLQAKYAPKGVAFIGVTAESPEVARAYVTNMGDSMNYTVAADYQVRTSRAYASLFNVTSIPHAYLVGADGKIEWHGHPMDPQFVLALEVFTR